MFPTLTLPIENFLLKVRVNRWSGMAVPFSALHKLFKDFPAYSKLEPAAFWALTGKSEGRL